MTNKRIEIRRGDLHYKLKITPEVRVLLEDYARINETTMIDAGNRIFIEFFTKFHGFEDPNKFVKELRQIIFPNRRAIYDAIWSILHGKMPRRQPIALRKDGKSPFPGADSGSSDQDNS